MSKLYYLEIEVIRICFEAINEQFEREYPTREGGI